jgi:hypothetical protein
MNIKFLPKNKLGWWSIGLIALVSILFYTGMLLSDYYSPTPAGDTILEDLMTRPLVSISMLSGFLAGISAFFCGIIGIIKRRDYSILMIISTIFGFLVLLWVIIEIIFPH